MSTLSWIIVIEFYQRIPIKASVFQHSLYKSTYSTIKRNFVCAIWRRILLHDTFFIDFVSFFEWILTFLTDFQPGLCFPERHYSFIFSKKKVSVNSLLILSETPIFQWFLAICYTGFWPLFWIFTLIYCYFRKKKRPFW